MRHLALFVENGCGIISAKGDCKMTADEILISGITRIILLSH